MASFNVYINNIKYNISDILQSKNSDNTLNKTYSSYTINSIPISYRKRFADNYVFSSFGNLGMTVSNVDIGTELCPKFWYYSFNGTHTFSANCTRFYCIAVGGGGGGGSGGAETNATGDAGNGGGGGGMLAVMINRPTTMTNLSIVVGDGGTGGAQRTNNGQGNAGNPGKSTTIAFGSFVATAGNGGGGGGGYTGVPNTTLGGGGGRGNTGFTISEDHSINGYAGYQGTGGGDTNTPSVGAASVSGGLSGFHSSSTIFNIYMASAGDGGSSGRGDISTDYGTGGSAGYKGFVFIFEYFN